MQTPEIPDKVFFKIGEVSRLIGVPEHTLRYWEEEFGQVRPEKTKSGQRLYRRRDIDLLLQIKRLLWEEKFKIAGARQQLKRIAQQQRERAKERQEKMETETRERRVIQGEVERLQETVSRIRHEVDELLALVEDADSRGVAQSG